MPRFKIVTPVPGFRGESAGVQFVDGAAVVDSDIPEQRKALSYFRKAGYGVSELDPDGNPIDPDALLTVDASVVDDTGNENPQVADPGVDPDGQPAPAVPVNELPPLPSPNANKPEWITAAELRGYTYDQADDYTKPVLAHRLREGLGPDDVDPDATEQDTEDQA